jgi:hypothetical protein
MTTTETIDADVENIGTLPLFLKTKWQKTKIREVSLNFNKK